MDQESATQAQEGESVNPVDVKKPLGFFILIDDFEKLYDSASKLEYAQAIKIMPFLEKSRAVNSVTEMENGKS